MRIYWDCFERRIGASIIIIIVVSMCRAKSMRSCLWQLSIGLERAQLAFSDGIFDRRQEIENKSSRENLLFDAETKVTKLLT